MVCIFTPKYTWLLKHPAKMTQIYKCFFEHPAAMMKVLNSFLAAETKVPGLPTWNSSARLMWLKPHLQPWDETWCVVSN